MKIGPKVGHAKEESRLDPAIFPGRGEVKAIGKQASWGLLKIWQKHTVVGVTPVVIQLGLGLGLGLGL
jgi:hypothetical protein